MNSMHWLRGLVYRLRAAFHRRRNARRYLASRHLRGDGIEIGAMHFPLPPHRGMRVKYVDNTSLEDSIAKFPELRGQNLVRPDFIEDGFELASFSPASQDFVIANHVLEHAPNPLRTLSNWVRVLRPGGALLVSVPLAEACFDRGRTETTLGHLLQDFQATTEQLAARNLVHYVDGCPSPNRPYCLSAIRPTKRLLPWRSSGVPRNCATCRPRSISTPFPGTRSKASCATLQAIRRWACVWRKCLKPAAKWLRC